MCLGKETGEGTFLSKMEIELFRISLETRKKGIENKGTKGGLTEGLGKKCMRLGLRQKTSLKGKLQRTSENRNE